MKFNPFTWFRRRPARYVKRRVTTVIVNASMGVPLLVVVEKKR